MNGKLMGRKDNKTGRIQSLEDHSLAVAKIMQNFTGQIHLANIGYVIGYYHDMGKACDAFECHLTQGNKETIDHATVGAKYLYEEYLKMDNSISQIVIQLITLAIMCHHTGLIDFVDANGNSPYLKRFQKGLPTYQEAIKKFNDQMELKNTKDMIIQSEQELISILKNLFSRYEKYGGVYGSQMQMFELSLLGRFLSGALHDADCLDAAGFSEEMDVKQRYLSTQISSTYWSRLYEKLIQYIEQISDDSEVNQIRNKISEACDRAGLRTQGIYELYAPTGCGKTIASLRFALKHAMIHESIQRIIYVAPLNTILNQNAKTIQEILFGESVSPEDFLNHNSSVIAEDNDEYRKYTQRWNSRIIMTSTVQFLNTLFKGQKKDTRRMHQLCNSIIILDEVQSFSPKLLHMFNTAMNFLHNICHSTIVICTATQPQLHEITKPLLRSQDYSLVHGFEQYYKKLNRVIIENDCKENGYDLDELARYSVDKVCEMGSMLIVVNKKEQAKELFQKLNEQLDNTYYIYHLSSSMCLLHRREVLNEVLDKMHNHEKVILISTNLIEAGVDISFPLVIRTLAGLDSIIQCAGRCNRSGEWGENQGKVYIVNIKNENLDQLEDVKRKQLAMKIFLDEYRRNPEIFENDISSLTSLNKFYKIYNNMLMNKHEDEDRNSWASTILDYQVPKKKYDIYDLLSTNWKGDGEQEFPYPLKFAYAEAGKAFHVIDQDTIDVIVPYVGENGNGAELICALEASEHELSYEEEMTLLREAQNYTVSLYPYQIEKLGGDVVEIKRYGVMALNESCYDKQLGVLLEGQCYGIYC